MMTLRYLYTGIDFLALICPEPLRQSRASREPCPCSSTRSVTLRGKLGRNMVVQRHSKHST